MSKEKKVKNLDIKDIYLQIKVIADDQEVISTQLKTEDTEPGVTWNRLLYNFKNVLIALGYAWRDDIDLKFNELINSGIDKLI